MQQRFLSYVGQTSRNLKTRFQEHIRYVKTNSPQSASAQHILHNQHEYGTLTESMTLLKPLQNESMLLPFEQFHIQSLHQAGKLIPEQYLNDPNPLFQLTFSHPHHTLYKTETVNQQASCKPAITLSSAPDQQLENNTYVHLHFQCMHLSITSTFIQLHPTNGIPDPTDRNHQALHYKKAYQEHPHTAPTTLDTPYNKPR